jgi:hypothetical protein
MTAGSEYAHSALPSGDYLDRARPGEHTAAFVDAEDKPTHDPAKAVGGQIVDYDATATPKRRTWFRVEEVEISWLPMTESAFLLWVLVLLVAVWLGIGLALGLF